jgi:glycosyltransferase involved in cell wall biosynthesis
LAEWLYPFGADLYHIHEPDLLLLLPVIRLFIPKAKFVYDIHENYSDAVLSTEKHWIPQIMKPAVAWVVNTIEKLLAKRTDLVIAAAPDIEVRFVNCRTISIRNYAPMDIINSIYENKGKLPKSKTAEVIYTGSLTKTRGILEIVKAIDLVDLKYNVHFAVTGKFHDTAYQRLIEREPGRTKMDFMGFLPSYETMVARVINANAAMVCFHEDQNLDNAVERSNKLFEYMGMGLPVIVGNLPDWAAMINKYQCGVVVNPHDPGDIARAIEKLLANPKEALAMGNRGRQAVLDNFSWEIEGKRLVETYGQLLA